MIERSKTFPGSRKIRASALQTFESARRRRLFHNGERRKPGSTPAMAKVRFEWLHLEGFAVGTLSRQVCEEPNLEERI